MSATGSRERERRRCANAVSAQLCADRDEAIIMNPVDIVGAQQWLQAGRHTRIYPLISVEIG